MESGAKQKKILRLFSDLRLKHKNQSRNNYFLIEPNSVIGSRLDQCDLFGRIVAENSMGLQDPIRSCQPGSFRRIAEKLTSLWSD